MGGPHYKDKKGMRVAHKALVSREKAEKIRHHGKHIESSSFHSLYAESSIGGPSPHPYVYLWPKRHERGKQKKPCSKSIIPGHGSLVFLPYANGFPINQTPFKPQPILSLLGPLYDIYKTPGHLSPSREHSPIAEHPSSEVHNHLAG